MRQESWSQLRWTWPGIIPSISIGRRQLFLRVEPHVRLDEVYRGGARSRTFPWPLTRPYQPAITSTGRLWRSKNRRVPDSVPTSAFTPSFASLAVAAVRSNPATLTQ